MRNFYPFPTSPYNGTFSARPFNGSNGQNTMINALVKWATYTIAGQSLGTQNPDFNVTMDLNAAASNTVSMSWVIRSVYIDNMGSNFPVFVVFPSTGFAISCPANSSGWYQVFASDRRAWICASGISDIDISNLATTSVFFTDGVVNSYLDQEEPTAIDMRLASPVISYGGGGGGIASIVVSNYGQWCSSGALMIAGGGGHSAVASGNRDSFGRIISVSLIAPGAGYTGNPSVTYVGGYAPPAFWNSGTIYNKNDVIQYNGYVYASNYNNLSGQFIPSGAPISNQYWTYTGFTAAFIAPTFVASITPIVSGVSFSNIGTFGASALGDQIASFIDTVAAPGIIHANLFNTPYNSGFIYITNIDIRILQESSGGNTQWQLEDDDGNAILIFYGSSAGSILDIQGCNLKLKASVTYNLRVTGAAGSTVIFNNFVWTYSNN